MSLPVLNGTARVVSGPDLRFSPSGTAVAKMRLVFSERRKDPNTGEWTDGDKLWVNAVAFKQLAENLAESITGKPELVVSGRLKTEEWTDKEGNKRSDVSLLLDSVGPSLRFDTVTINKMDRSGGGGNGGRNASTSDRVDRGSGAAPDPWATSQPSGSRVDGGSSGWDDEAPF